jgi:hypothetical protein
MTITRRDFIMTGACAAATAASASAQQLVPRKYQIGAYYFPNFHIDPRNEMVHGKGWTEWEVLKRGEPNLKVTTSPKNRYGDQKTKPIQRCFRRK